MPKKSLTDLFGFCDRMWNDVDNFCEDSSPTERAVIFGAVRQRLSFYKKVDVVENAPALLVEKPKKSKKTCDGEFKPENDSKCFIECKENTPDDYKKCLEKFQEKVVKKANAKKKEKSEPESEPTKKGRTFDKDFWGFDKKAITGKINEMVSEKFCTKTEIAEALGIDGKRVAVHFSNLKTSGHIMKKKKKDGDVFYKLTKEVSE